MCSFREPAWHTAHRNVRGGTPSTARNAPGGRDGRTRPAISPRLGRAPRAPSAVRRSAGCFLVRRLALVALFAGREFKRHNHPAAAFLRAIAVLFVSHKEFQGSQNKRPKLALFRVGTIEIPPFEHADEKLLREVLRLIGWITAPAQIGIQRIPVVLTQRNQSDRASCCSGLPAATTRVHRVVGNWDGPGSVCMVWPFGHDLILTALHNRHKESEAKGYSAITTACRTLLWRFSRSG